LCVEGQPVETPLTIPLTTGWNIIGYPCEYAQNALTAVQTLINAGVLTKVIDESGGSIFHLPFPPPNGQWSNTIGNFESGEGYYVKVTGNVTLNIDCPSGPTDLTNRTPKIIDPVYFNPVYENNPYMPMHIAVYTSDELMPGDEIGVFDGDVCVGAAIYNGNSQNPIIIKTAMDDPTTEVVDGFTTGNPIGVFTAKNPYGEISQIVYQSIEGSINFEGLSTMICSVDEILTGISAEETSLSAFEIIPNPFTNQTHIHFSFSEPTLVTIDIMNMKGEIVSTSIPERYESGKNIKTLDFTRMSKGVYMMHISCKTDSQQYTLNRRLIRL